MTIIEVGWWWLLLLAKSVAQVYCAQLGPRCGRCRWYWSWYTVEVSLFIKERQRQSIGVHSDSDSQPVYQGHILCILFSCRMISKLHNRSIFQHVWHTFVGISYPPDLVRKIKFSK